MNRITLAAILASSMVLQTDGARAATIVYEAALSGPAEAPPNASPGTGLATVTYDDVAHTLRVEVTFAGLLGTTTASHIHIATVPFGTGGVVTQTPSFSGFPLGVTSGSMDSTFNLQLAGSWNPSFLNGAGGGSTATAESLLSSGLQNRLAYLNVHTTSFPGGEIRGFLIQAVPEPATWALLLLGFGLAGAALRRRPALAKASAGTRPSAPG